MKVIIAFCLIALCFAASNENNSLFSRLLGKVQEIKKDIQEDVSALKGTKFDPKKVLEETIKLAKDLTHTGENTESVLGEDSFKTVSRIHNFNKKIVSAAVHTVSSIKAKIANQQLNAEHSFGEEALHKLQTAGAKAKTVLNKAVEATKSAAHTVAENNTTKTVVNATKHAVNVTVAAVNATAHKIAESNVTKAVVNATKHAVNATVSVVNATAHKIAASNITKAVVNTTKNAVSAAKSALGNAASWIKDKVSNTQLNAEQSFGEEVLHRLHSAGHKAHNALHKATNATKSAIHNVAHANKTQKAVNATKHAVNATVAVARAILSKSSSWIKGFVAHHMLNAEEKQTLAQKIAEKSHALLNKAKAQAAKIHHRISHHENQEVHFGEHVVHHVKVGAHKTGAAVRKAAEVTKTTLTNVWNKLAGF